MIVIFKYISESMKIQISDDTHDQLMAPFIEAKKQGAFVIYNHPSYAWWDKKDTTLFTNFHKELFNNKILQGVEVVNSGNYNIIAHKLAMKYNLTMLSNTDAHNGLPQHQHGNHRPITLVFAKDRTTESIHEALKARRTALYFDDYIAARQTEAESFFKSAVKVTIQKKNRKNEKILEVSLINISKIPFQIKVLSDYDIEKFPLGQVTLAPHNTAVLTLKAMWIYPQSISLQMQVSNIIISPEESLKTEFVIPVNN